jgi:HlyD family secretion protein
MRKMASNFAGPLPRLLQLAALLLACSAQAAAPQDGTITALGRLEPKDGVLRISGPSLPVVVIAELRVEEGDFVEQGQVLAVLDSHALRRAKLEQARAELDNAERGLSRVLKLYASDAASDAVRDEAELRVKVARAQLAFARAELDLSLVRAPIAGQVLAIHARAGERPGSEGIVELGRTGEMYAVAEVYETDISRVREGQQATITSPALPAPLTGRVEKVGLQVGKMDVLDADPVAKTDARVVEVEIRLDDHPDFPLLTYLQVKVEISP